MAKLPGAKKFSWLLAAAFLGAGLVGGLASNWLFLYLNRYYDYAQPSNVNFANPNQQIVIQDAKKIVVQQDDNVALTVRTVHADLVGLYKLVPAAAKAKSPADYYQLNQALGQGVIATSDGWILTNWQPDSLAGTWYKNYVVIGADRKIYNLDKVLADSAGGFTFLHLAGARDLSVLKFTASNNLFGGQSVVAIDWLGRVDTASLDQIDKAAGQVRSSDEVWRELSLNHSLNNHYLVLAGLAGDIIGLYNHDGKLVGAQYLSQLAASLASSQQLKRPWLGLTYLDLSLTAGPTLASGVLLVRNGNLPAVLPGSPAATAGLVANDIITSIDGTKLDGANDLGIILSGHQVGDRLDIVYQRSGKTLETAATLVAAK